MLYATTFPPLLFTFPTLISTFPTLISTFLNYFFLIPSSVVTNLMQFQGMGTHPSVFSIYKKRICIFVHTSEEEAPAVFEPGTSLVMDGHSTDVLSEPLTKCGISCIIIYVRYKSEGLRY